jgi:hypothetical protein
MSSSSSPSGSATIDVPNNHVSLVLPLVKGSSKQFHLQIPLEIIHSLCSKPCKYLIYLGWCILGVEGQLTLRRGGNIINRDGDLANRGVYYYDVRDHISTSSFLSCTMECLWSNKDPAHIVDLEVIKARTNIPSETTQMHENFRAELLERDVYCILTGLDSGLGNASHIIPFKRGSEVCDKTLWRSAIDLRLFQWFRLIVDNRPTYNEDVTDLNDINDIRNGVFITNTIHAAFDKRDVVFLKVSHLLSNDLVFFL